MGSVGRSVSLRVRGSLSVRATFHNVPVDIPPPPSVSCNESVYYFLAWSLGLTCQTKPKGGRT
jgi:hypothetical protein